jgi:hypothetical protein
VARLFEDRRDGQVSIVDAPVSRSYARKARFTFYVLGFGLSVVVSAVLATLTHPARAVVLGVAVGAAVGFVAGALVQVWPVLRVFWHWSSELAAASTAAVGLVWAGSTVGWLVTGVAAGVVVLVLVAAGPVRRRLVAGVWCVSVRHRLRVCFADFVVSPIRL